jgi:hypothetical protein
LTALVEVGRSYALLADGTTLTIRPAGPGDYGAVKGLHEAMSPENLYFRFCSASAVAAEQEARRVCREAGPDHGALIAPADCVRPILANPRILLWQNRCWRRVRRRWPRLEAGF